jgi:hypothetical protein
MLILICWEGTEMPQRIMQKLSYRPVKKPTSIKLNTIKPVYNGTQRICFDRILLNTGT